jgi:hypothetical protein
LIALQHLRGTEVQRSASLAEKDCRSFPDLGFRSIGSDANLAVV